MRSPNSEKVFHALTVLRRVCVLPNPLDSVRWWCGPLKSPIRFPAFLRVDSTQLHVAPVVPVALRGIVTYVTIFTDPAYQELPITI